MNARKKNSNPLYVVKGDQVEPAENFVELLIKKFNLEPLIELMMNILKTLMENVASYPMFMLVKDFLDQLMARIELFKKFSIA
ncbi:MAG: hypothetical protein VYA54_02375 [Bdellovibrionota bacterium]|nr:hypothetical protein [Bdellovibrionota bacterium]